MPPGFTPTIGDCPLGNFVLPSEEMIYLFMVNWL